MSWRGSVSKSMMSTARASAFRSSMPLSAPRRMRSRSVPSSRLNSLGYHLSKRAYPGKMALSSLLKSAKNKCIDIGGEKYQIKGCAGQGVFAQVFKAYLNSNPDDDVALKIQKPPFPENERKSFDFAHKYCTSTLTTAMERRRTKTRVDDDCVDDDSRGGRTW
ncbi:hypothetical protein OROMI_011243 [Orobanche minor]